MTHFVGSFLCNLYDFIIDMTFYQYNVQEYNNNTVHCMETMQYFSDSNVYFLQ